ncbi:MAG: NUDIX domain-containing protein, partial [Planctomycetota bacterium]
VAAGGTICFPGGHIEPGEEEHEAVVRECREELAAVVEPAGCIWRSVSPWGTSLAWWTVRLVEAGELVPHPVEVAEILWLSIDEMLADPTLLEGNRPFLEAIRAGSVVV